MQSHYSGVILSLLAVLAVASSCGVGRNRDPGTAERRVSRRAPFGATATSAQSPPPLPDAGGRLAASNGGRSQVPVVPTSPPPLHGSSAHSHTVETDVVYSAGWSMIAVVATADTPFPVAPSSLYALPAAQALRTYVMLSPSQALAPGVGYWVLFATPVVLHVSGKTPQGQRIYGV